METSGAQWFAWFSHKQQEKALTLVQPSFLPSFHLFRSNASFLEIAEIKETSAAHKMQEAGLPTAKKKSDLR